MKTITVLILALVAFASSGCTTRGGVSVGHEGHRHGIGVKGSTEDGVSGGVRTY